MEQSPNTSSTESLPTQVSGSTTTDVRVDSDLDAFLESLASALGDFSVGKSSEHELWDAFRKYLTLTGDDGLVAMAARNARTPFPTVSLATVLRMLGVDPSPATTSGAKWLLVRSLKDAHATIRDGALAGLMNLDDSSAAAPIERAAAAERVEALRHDMVDALAQWAQ